MLAPQSPSIFLDATKRRLGLIRLIGVLVKLMTIEQHYPEDLLADKARDYFNEVMRCDDPQKFYEQLVTDIFESTSLDILGTINRSRGCFFLVSKFRGIFMAASF